jgi:hypothetical protein
MEEQPHIITPADRIRELSDINTDVAGLLSSAGQAVNALTNRPLNQPGESQDAVMKDASDTSLEARKQAFNESTANFFHGLQGAFARLRRQAYALEEAGIIAPELPLEEKKETRSAGSLQPAPKGNPHIPKEQQLDPERVKNGGLGNLDVGWLNSRGNKVGAEKEAELIQEAKELLETMLARGDNMG